MSKLWITTNPENAASRVICEWLGAIYVDTVDVPPDHEISKHGDHQNAGIGGNCDSRGADGLGIRL